MSLPLYCIFGVSHHSAPVEVRSRVAIPQENLDEILNSLAAMEIIDEVCIITTCNRTEYHFATKCVNGLLYRLKSFLRSRFPALSPEDFQSFFFYQETTAVNHLFRVTAGLESMILGEPQIVCQVKKALQDAENAGTVGEVLRKVFQMAFHFSKRVRNETAIARGAISVGYAAIESLQTCEKGFSDKTALVIGAGETGELLAGYLYKKGIERLIITNRTFSKAAAVAQEFHGEAIPYNDFPKVLADVDFILGSTSSPEPVLEKETVSAAMARRPERPLTLIDLAIPRDFDPEISTLPNTTLIDLDYLQQVVNRNRRNRQQEMPAVDRIIAEGIEKYLDWQHEIMLKPLIIDLRQKFETIRNIELQKHLHRSTKDEYEKIEMATRGMLNKILHLPLLKLRDFNVDPVNPDKRIKLVRDIFDLE